MNFAFLTTIDSPLLPWFISSALRHGVRNISVFCDSRLISEKDLRIWNERTGDAFNRAAPTLYAFAKEGIPFYFVESHNAEESVGLIKSLKIDCLLNAGTPRRLSKTLL